MLEYGDIIHFSTTRIGGVSSKRLESLNLGYTVNDNPKNVTQNLDSLAKSLLFEKEQMVSPKQTHSKNIGIVNSSKDLFPDKDALITNKSEICIFIRTADCVPILLYDPIQKAIAAIHSGWKSTIQEISKHTIELMQKEFGTKPENLIAGVGPSIGPEVYEVGIEVTQMFHKQFGVDHMVNPIKNSNKYLLNLWKANKQILLDSGIPENQIEIAKICTYTNPELFYSARRDGVKTGRLATGIMLKS
ncbi:MAG: peptidoglycan editing factor PgeF [Bacteroidales bacterium]|nr:peptidoglycan editing factor PgeF [Bacteroidales bacterium]